jgi:hypothetical protein
MWLESGDHYFSVFVQFAARSPGGSARMAEAGLARGVVHLLVMRNPFPPLNGAKWEVAMGDDTGTHWEWRVDGILTNGGFEAYIPLPLLLVPILAATGRSMWRRRALSRTPGTCAKCGYDVRGLPIEHACPECGSRERQPHESPGDG